MKVLHLVADGATGRLFESEGWKESIEEIERFVNEDGRLNNRDFGRDAPGRSFKGGSRRGSFEEREEPKERHEKKFAKQLAEKLNRKFDEKGFDKLVVVAAHKTLGELRKHFNKRVKDTIEVTSTKNFTKASLEEIEKHIGKIR
jgi:protein required for attachment to host cells